MAWALKVSSGQPAISSLVSAKGPSVTSGYYRNPVQTERLRQTVQQLAQSMEGLVCDGAGTPLHSDAMDQIGAELEALCEALQARELAPGSVLARRLFS